MILTLIKLPYRILRFPFRRPRTFIVAAIIALAVAHWPAQAHAGGLTDYFNDLFTNFSNWITTSLTNFYDWVVGYAETSVKDVTPTSLGPSNVGWDQIADITAIANHWFPLMEVLTMTFSYFAFQGVYTLVKIVIKLF